MWKIEANGTDLNFDGKISIVLNNPMFYDVISYSLQFNVINDENGINQKALGFINLPEAKSIIKNLPCKIWMGPLLFTGTLVASYQNKQFQCYFKSYGTFWDQINDKKLSEINFDRTSIADITEFLTDTIASSEIMTFPTIINKEIFKNFDVKFLADGFINLYDSTPVVASNNPTVPFFYLHYVVKQIFEKHGIKINQSALYNLPFLKKLVLPNTHILNEYSIDDTVVELKPCIVRKVTEAKEPQVTTTVPHGITNYGFIIFDEFFDGILSEGIHQVEVIDDLNFKVLNIDTTDSENIPLEFRTFYAESYTRTALGIIIELEEDVDISIDTNRYWFHAPDIRSTAGFIEGTIHVFYQTTRSILLAIPEIDPDFETNEYGSLWLRENGTDRPTYNTKLLNHDMVSTFTEINPANHMPDIKINEFLNELKKLGIICFVNNSNVDIKTISEVLLSKNFVDITTYSEEIKTTDANPLNGFNLVFTADSTDSYYKKRLPSQTIDPKYTVKDPVSILTDLNGQYINAENLDVRLVIAENIFYAYNKTFLAYTGWVWGNAFVFRWKQLCYNLLNYVEGKGDLKIETKFSPLLPDFDTKYARMDVTGVCKTFPEQEVSINPRLLTYHGMVNNKPYASSDIYDLDGNIIAGADFVCRWEGLNGLYDKLLQHNIYWNLNLRKDCVALIHWPLKHLINFNFSKKYRIDANDYLAKSIKFSGDFKTESFAMNDTELAKV